MRFSKKKLRIAVCLLFVCLACLVIFVKFSNEKATQTTPLSDDYVEFLDVGQGDCALISSNGKSCLIDTGSSNSAGSIEKKLKNEGIKNIDLISISHFHIDHTGSLYDLVSSFDVKKLMFPNKCSDTNIPEKVLSAKNDCINNGGEVYTEKVGMTADVGDFKLTVLYYSPNLNGENNRSVYIMAKINDIKFFFTGDGQKQAENDLLSKGFNLDCDVLKVPHHGGSASSNDNFLDATTPEYAVVSCGIGNTYGHPHKETMDRLTARNIKTYRTDENGDVSFFIDDNKLSVTTDK